LARRLGWSDDQIDHLSQFESRNDFDVREKSALRLAETMTRNPQSFDDEHWNDLRKHFDEGQVIELVAAIGLFNYFNRVNDVLRMEPTK
jgi:alkylhydroperoxidase family enzyme